MRLKKLSFEALEARIVLAPVVGHASDVPVSNDSVLVSKPAPLLPIVNGSETSEFPAVGLVGDGCTGTLISSQHVLTAAHCVDEGAPSAGVFELAGRTYATVRQVIHPDYDFFSLDSDIGVMVLAEPVEGVSPQGILKTAPLVGESLTLVGFGYGGTTFNPVFDIEPVKRVGVTELETVTRNQLRWTFDGAGESNTAPGDSGGPGLVNRNGELLIAGVTSGGDGDPWNRFGEVDHSWDTRVDTFADWIDSVLAAPIPQQEEDEHSNQADGHATEVTFVSSSAWESGALQTNLDRDVFRFELATRAGVTISAVSPDGQLDTVLTLLDGAGDELAKNDDILFGLNSNSQIRQTLNAGQYFVSLESYSGASSGRYSLVIDTARLPINDIHAGTPDTTATQLATDADGHVALRSSLETQRDQDAFAFEVLETGTTRISATALDGVLDTQLRLYDRAGRLLESNDDLIGAGFVTDSLIETSLDPGTYFATVSSFGSFSQGEYIVAIDTPVPNARFDRATIVELDPRGAALVQGDLISDGEAIYQVTSRFNGALYAAARALDADGLDIRLASYDAGTELIGANDDLSLENSNSRLEFNVRENQVIYVVVSAGNDSEGEFTLTLRTRPGQRLEPPEPLKAVEISPEVPSLGNLEPHWLAMDDAFPWEESLLRGKPGMLRSVVATWWNGHQLRGLEQDDLPRSAARPGLHAIDNAVLELYPSKPLETQQPQISGVSSSLSTARAVGERVAVEFV